MSFPEQSPNQLLAFLRRRWPSLLIAAGVAAAGGIVVAQKLAVQTYTCVGSMLYNRSGAGAPQYQQPEMQSIVGLVKSQPVLEDAAKRLPWNPPAKALAASVQTEAVIGSNSLQFTMRGDDPERTRQGLDAVMEALRRQAGALRTRTVGQILAAQEAYLAGASANVDSAADRLARFNRENQITISVDEDLERVRDDIAAVETALETQQTVRTPPEEQLQRRRQLLEEQQEADRAQLEREAALALKRNEYDRAQRLHAKRYISDAEFRRIETEFAALQAQHTEAFEQRRARLKQLGEALSAQLNRTADDSGSAAGGDAAAAARIQSFLTQRRNEAIRLNMLRPQAEELRQAVIVAQTEAQRAAAQVAAFRELRDADYHDLVVVQRAAAAFDPVSSNKKKLLAGASVAIFLGCLMPIVLRDLLRRNSGNQGIGPLLERVPEISPVGGRIDGDRNDLVRTLALRIQQSAREDGSLALFTSADEGASPVELVVDAAKCLANRGETVLLVDASADPRFGKAVSDELVAKNLPDASVGAWSDWTGERRRSDANPAPLSRTDALQNLAGRGLAELLCISELVPDDVVLPARQFDVLPSGSSTLPTEAFASRRLSELLVELRRRYSTILLIGPNARHSVDLEMLAARVTSLVIVARREGSPTPVTIRTIDTLQAGHAPILGLVAV